MWTRKWDRFSVGSNNVRSSVLLRGSKKSKFVLGGNFTTKDRYFSVHVVTSKVRFKVRAVFGYVRRFDV